MHTACCFIPEHTLFLSVSETDKLGLLYGLSLKWEKAIREVRNICSQSMQASRCVISVAGCVCKQLGVWQGYA